MAGLCNILSCIMICIMLNLRTINYNKIYIVNCVATIATHCLSFFYKFNTKKMLKLVSWKYTNTTHTVHVNILQTNQTLISRLIYVPNWSKGNSWSMYTWYNQFWLDIKYYICICNKMYSDLLIALTNRDG